MSLEKAGHRLLKSVSRHFLILEQVTALCMLLCWVQG